MANETEEPQDFGKHLGTEIITIRAGRRPKSQKFSTHMKLLSIKCPTLNDYIRPPTTEGKSKVIDLSSETTETVELFLRWLYQDKFNFREAGTSENEMLNNSIQLFLFAYSYRISRLGDNVMDSLKQYYSDEGSLLNPFNLAAIYDELDIEPLSGFQEYLASSIAYSIFHGGQQIPIHEIINEMGESKDLSAHVLEILRREGVQISNPATLSNCRFHDHYSIDEPCPYGPLED